MCLIVPLSIETRNYKNRPCSQQTMPEFTLKSSPGKINVLVIATFAKFHEVIYDQEFLNACLEVHCIPP